MKDEKYPYLYETHCHTCWGSGCGVSTPYEMAGAYYEAGYAGMVFTDHFLLGNSAVPKEWPWREKMERYYSVYLAAREWAQGKDFDVLFGIEHNYGHGKEVLTYGIDLDFLLSNPDIHLLPLSEYSRLVHQWGGFISMAHPFRDRDYIDMDVGPEPEYLDALEVYNYHNYPEENERAVELARAAGLPGTSGGDVHIYTDGGIKNAGIALPRRARTGKELADILRSRDYRIIYNGELIDCNFS
ncbi:MAG: histidinol-phosphatase [Acutalibacter sp.]|jgi:predicted metal-dependent phosphoesterase TrpH|uniref:PHP domain-containing protein n=1 Tax=Acutalibacter sp. TaxID=1918636 RepID=UPI002170D240|nr:PHP domain-containing protein [Acutalibacter sp.]MCI9223923.1 histidinol-phosphatase [Acutalibacter sp.]